MQTGIGIDLGLPNVFGRGQKDEGILETVAVAFSMFSALPMPRFPGKNWEYAVCAVCLPSGGRG